MVDVGGGSSEIAWGEAGAMRGFVSLATGAVRLRQQFCADDPVRPQRLAAMITELDAMVAKLPQIAAPQVYAYACSGSIRRIAALCGGDPSELSVAQIDAVIESLVAAPSRAERLLIPAMDPSRVDVLLAGALIHRALAQHFGWSQFRLSSGGLRRGLLEAQR
jgi:exopolyphosphatase/guanosine-5'-triphosphate,3'-diphosphate pyrophosphatase